MSKSWEESYNKVCKFVEEHQRIPEYHDKEKESDESKLGNWIRRMRSTSNREKLTSYQKDKLEKIKGWYWSIEELNERKWLENYEKVKLYYDKNTVPLRSSEDEEEKKLAEWCVTQRRSFKENKLNDMKAYYLEDLNNWDWGFSQEKLWDETFEKLKLFIEKEKRFPQHIRNNENNYDELRLANWCDGNRKNKKISEERVIKLKTIGFYDK
jgi:hypothetical protein